MLAGAADTLNKVLIVGALLSVLMLVVAAIVIWDKYASLSPGQKWLIKLAIIIAVVLYAFMLGWIAGDDLRRLGIPVTWDEWTDWATVKVMWFEGWARSHQWFGIVLALGALLLVALPVRRVKQ